MSLYSMELKARDAVRAWARVAFGIALLSVGLAGRASYRDSSVDPGLAIAYAALFLGIALLWSPATQAVLSFARELLNTSSKAS